MANARQQKLPKALIRRTLESARREIEQIERKFHRTPPIPLNAHRGRKGRASEGPKTDIAEVGRYAASCQVRRKWPQGE